MIPQRPFMIESDALNREIEKRFMDRNRRQRRKARQNAHLTLHHTDWADIMPHLFRQAPTSGIATRLYKFESVARCIYTFKRLPLFRGPSSDICYSIRGIQNLNRKIYAESLVLEPIFCNAFTQCPVQRPGCGPQFSVQSPWSSPPPARLPSACLPGGSARLPGAATCEPRSA